MSSTYLTIPGLVLVFFVSWKRLRRHWPWMALLAVSLLMVAGPRSAFWQVLTSLLDPLWLSRFPSSDYRPLVAVALVVLAAYGLRSLQEGAPSRAAFVARGVAALGAVVLAGRALYGSWTAPPVLHGAAVALVTLGLSAAIRRWPHAREWRLLVAALVALIGLDAVRVLPEMQTWKEPDVGTLYERRGWGSSVQGVVDPSIFAGTPGTRPAREETGHPHWYWWAGYLEGRYMMADKAPCILASAH